MNTGKKVLNVFGIIISLILSVVLVILITVAPILISSLNLTKQQTLTQIMNDITITDEMVVPDGQEPSEETANITKLMNTTAFKKVISLYVADILNSSSDKEPKLTAETFNQIIKDNIEEISIIVRDLNPEFKELSKEEAEQKTEEFFAANYNEFFAQLPPAHELRQELIAQMPDGEMFFEVWSYRSIIIITYIGIIVFISLLIFLCRLPKFRGIRWLSIDLFIAFSFAAVYSAGIKLTSSFVANLDNQIAGVEKIIEPIYSAFTKGIVIRTGGILLFAIILLVAYIFIKKALKKKEAIVQSNIIEEQLPATQENQLTENN